MLFLANASFVCLFVVRCLSIAVFLCLDHFLRGVVLHNAAIASRFELSGVSHFQVVCFQAPFIFLAPECSVLFSLLRTFVLILFLSVHHCAVSRGFAPLLGDVAMWSGRALFI